jgi:DNA-directed RNA polymerase
MRGLYWLKVHGANKYGYDKVSYDERVQWIDEQEDTLLSIAADPIGMRACWQDADKPWQYLAFVFEFAAAHEYGEGYRSSLPVALDGSCNGLQHFSAMLRDPLGGGAVNLIPGDKPEDIYQQVADVCTSKLKALTGQPGDQTGAHNWLRLFGDEGMPRKLSKKPVMTLPYGSTQNACTSSIFQWVHEEHPGFFDKNTDFRHALYLSPILWSSISEVVVAARSAMDWIQQQTVTITAAQMPLEYTTALGFRVYQSSRKFTMHQIKTQIGGALHMFVATDTDELDRRKQRQGSSPNLIHSVDATHLMMVVNAGLDKDIDCFSMIHDDFGVHAAHIDQWQEIIRETFVTLHEPADILQNFKDSHEMAIQAPLKDLPPIQNLDLTAVIRSPYFFG